MGVHARPRRIDAILARRGQRRGCSTPASRIHRTGVAVVTYTDTHLDVHRILALREGEVHLIRNAGSKPTHSVLMSLAMSQRVLHTREILVMHQMLGAGAFVDTALRVLQTAHSIARDPYLVDTELVRGVVYDEQYEELRVVCDFSSIAGAVPTRPMGQSRGHAAASNI